MFVLASAIVSFRGWPQVADQAPTVAVAIPQSGAVAGSPVGRRLTVALRARSATAPGRAGAGRTRRGAGSRVRTGATRGTPGSPPGSPLSSRQPASVSSSQACTGAACNVPVPPGTVTSVTGTVAQGVSGAGSSAGSAISGVAGKVAGELSGASPPAASAVQSTGASAGGAISGTASTVSSVVNTLGGGH